MVTVFWDSERIFVNRLQGKGLNITGGYYATLMKKFKDTIREKRRGKWTRGVVLLHDTALVHKSHVVMAALQNVATKHETILTIVQIYLPLFIIYLPN